MIKAPIPDNDEERLEELRSYQILDTKAEFQFDDITSLASFITDSPVALISLIDKDRQWFKSKFGLDEALKETPREVSFCGHAIMGNTTMEVTDAKADERFHDNPACLSEPGLRFYAGVPLISKNGHKLGTLCVVDYKSKSLSENQRNSLEKLARQVVLLFEARLREIILIETNTKLDGIVNNIPLMLSTFDKDGKFEWINKAWTKELGWTLEEMQKIPDMMIEMYPNSEDREAILNFMINPKTGEWKDCYTKIKNQNFIHTTWTNVKLETGKWIGIGQNIHDRKLIENELIKTNQRLDFVLEGAQLGSWDWWLETNQVYFDERWCTMLGLDFETTPKKISTWDNLLHPDDKEHAYQEISLYLEGKTDHYESTHRLRHASGSWVWILDKGKVSERDENGKPIRFTGTHFDITKQKEIEQELRDQQQKNHAIYDGSNDAIMVLNHAGFTDCNSKTLELFNVSTKEKFIACHPSDLSPKHQPDGMDSLTKANQHIKEAFEKGSAFFEWTHSKMNGEEFAAEVMLSAFDFQGERVLQATVRDISERKILQKKYEDQLLMSQQQAKLASIGQLAAGVGHEINNPLAIIKGYLSVVEEELRQSEKDIPRVYEMLKKIDIASNRITKIVQGLRTFSRSDTNQLADFCLKEAVEESFNLFNEIYTKQGINLSLELKTQNKLQVYGNKGRIEQVIVNLLSNAKDATENNEERKISLTLSEGNGFAHFAIEDNGQGIPDSIVNKIFDPFFSTKDVNKGSGIGLSIASSIVKEHHGEMTVNSKLNHGTIFLVTLPISKEERQSEVITSPTPHPLKGSTIRALVVDDEEDIRDILKMQLNHFGVECTLAGDGQEALNHYLKDPSFDLIITDLKMPKMTGLELALALNENPDIKKPKMIFITGGVNTDPSKFNDAIKIFDDHLYKPFEQDDLIPKIRALFPDKIWKE